MQYLQEQSDTINSPYEAFTYDASREDFPVRPHWHYYMEIILMTEGNAMFECDGKSVILSQGDMIMFYPMSIHSIYALTGFPIVYQVIKFNLSKIHTINGYAPRFDKILQAARQNESLPTVFRAGEISGLRLENYFEKCVYELNNRNFGYDVIVHNTISELLINVLRIWKQMGFDENKARELEQKETVLTVTAYIDQHSDENLDVDSLAARCGLSYSFFAKKFHQMYGRSCKEYLELVRVCKAEDLLLFTSHDINWIAQETGFSDASHLIKIFKRLRGITPKQYRLNVTRKKTMKDFDY